MKKNQDRIVSIDAMNRFMETISTATEHKIMKAFPEAGNHVIGSLYWNPKWSNVENEIIFFLENVMKMPARVRQIDNTLFGK